MDKSFTWIKTLNLDPKSCDLQSVNRMNRERERKDREPVDKQSVWATWAYRVYGPYLTPPFKLKAEVEDLKH